MKFIAILLLSISLSITACTKKNNNPTEYFSFDADGVHYEYPSEVTPVGLFGGGAKTLGAGPLSGNLGYDIYAFSQKNPVAPGEFRFSFSGNNIPLKDTLIFNDIEAYASINAFNTFGNNYYTDNINTGRIIFTSRTTGRLEGTFEFIAKQQNDGTLIHITNGKFSIIPAQEQS